LLQQYEINCLLNSEPYYLINNPEKTEELQLAISNSWNPMITADFLVIWQLEISDVRYKNKNIRAIYLGPTRHWRWKHFLEMVGLMHLADEIIAILWQRCKVSVSNLIPVHQIVCPAIASPWIKKDYCLPDERHRFLLEYPRLVQELVFQTSYQMRVAICYKQQIWKQLLFNIPWYKIKLFNILVFRIKF
jgi:hypothetical protein